MTSSHSAATARRGSLGRQRLVPASVALVALGLGLFLGWHSHWLQRCTGEPRCDKLLALLFTVSTTVACGELVRVSSDRRRWLAAGSMALVVLNAHARSVPIVPVIFAAVFWVTLLYGCARRERRWALWSAWVCGGSLAGALLLQLATLT